MEPQMMIRTAAVLFGLSAVGGLIMAVMRFRGIPRPPTWFAMGHGVAAAAGLTLLAYAALNADVPPFARFAAVLFTLAAVGGAALNLLFHSKQLPLPISWIIGHGVVAASGFVLLLLSL